MFTALLANTRASDLAEQKRLYQEKLRARLRRLRRQARHAAIVQRERALICRLLLRRFPPNSVHAVLLRLLARNASHYLRRFKRLLHKLSGSATVPLPRRRLFAWKCWYARNAPRKWALLRLKNQKDRQWAASGSDTFIY
jgi:hypothetical protein